MAIGWVVGGERAEDPAWLQMIAMPGELQSDGFWLHSSISFSQPKLCGDGLGCIRAGEVGRVTIAGMCTPETGKSHGGLLLGQSNIGWGQGYLLTLLWL